VMVDCKHENAKERFQIAWCPDCGAQRVCESFGGWRLWEVPRLALLARFDPERREILCPVCGDVARVVRFHAEREERSYGIETIVHHLTVMCPRHEVRMESKEERARQARAEALAAVKAAETALELARRRLSEMEQNGF